MDAYYTDENGKRTKLKPSRGTPGDDDSPAGAELKIRADHLEVRKGFTGPFRAGAPGLPTEDDA